MRAFRGLRRDAPTGPVSCTRDRWVALRRGTRRFVTADTIAGLEESIEADYRDHPVPRACGDPPRIAD